MSTTSFNPSSTTQSSSSNGACFDLGPDIGVFRVTVTNITHSVTLKLDRTNFLLWRAQLLLVIRSQGLIGFLDGTISAQSPSSPFCPAWNQLDQTIQSWIMATLSPAALGQVLDDNTAAAKWSTLSRVFASNLHARLMHLRYELQHLKKGDLSMPDFLDKAKSLADQLAAAGRPVHNDDLIFFILNGLSAEFEPLIMNVTSRPSPPSLEELQTVLLTQEHRLAVTTQMASLDLSSPTPTANVATRQQHGGRGGSRGRGQGRGFGPSRGRGGGRGHQGGGRGSSMPPSSPHSVASRPQCQLCNKRGHTVMQCFHRFDHAFQPSPPPVANTAYTSDQPSEGVWFPDSGASNHFTGDLSCLDDRVPYLGSD